MLPGEANLDEEGDYEKEAGGSIFSSGSGYDKLRICLCEYYGAAEPPVRCGESHLSGLTEPPVDNYSA